MRAFGILLLVPLLAFGGDTAKSDLNWLLGCWVSADESSHEVWVADSENSLQGFGVALNEGKVGFYELLSIKQAADGQWTYTAHPSGQTSASFTAVETGESSVVFVNPDHDYPQQISYRRNGNQLSATISLIGGGDPNSFEKVACE